MTNREILRLRNSYYLRTVGDVFALVGRYIVVTTVRPNPMQARAIEMAFGR